MSGARRPVRPGLPDGYVSGPAAATEATSRALPEADAAETIVLVEGISDQIAVETLAAHRGRDLRAERVAVLPVGGAHGVGRYLERYGPQGGDRRLRGLVDRAEAGAYRRGLVVAGLAPAPADGADLDGEPGIELDRFGFQVCVEDLEDELIRALGPDRVEAVLAANGDLGSFRTLQGQPAWRDRPVEAQLRRFFGAGARRKSRYAHLLVAALDDDGVPAPLDALFDSL